MLIPSFSLRSTLLGTAVCAVFCLVLSQAVGGHLWAIVIAAAVLSLLVTLLFYGMTYVATTVLTRLIGIQQTPALTSRGGLQTTPDQQVPPPSGDSSANA